MRKNSSSRRPTTLGLPEVVPGAIESGETRITCLYNDTARGVEELLITGLETAVNGS